MIWAIVIQWLFNFEQIQFINTQKKFPSFLNQSNRLAKLALLH